MYQNWKNNATIFFKPEVTSSDHLSWVSNKHSPHKNKKSEGSSKEQNWKLQKEKEFCDHQLIRLKSGLVRRTAVLYSVVSIRRWPTDTTWHESVARLSYQYVAMLFHFFAPCCAAVCRQVCCDHRQSLTVTSEEEKSTENTPEQWNSTLSTATINCNVVYLALRAVPLHSCQICALLQLYLKWLIILYHFQSALALNVWSEHHTALKIVWLAGLPHWGVATKWYH